MESFCNCRATDCFLFISRKLAHSAAPASGRLKCQSGAAPRPMHRRGALSLPLCDAGSTWVTQCDRRVEFCSDLSVDSAYIFVATSCPLTRRAAKARSIKCSAAIRAYDPGPGSSKAGLPSFLGRSGDRPETLGSLSQGRPRTEGSPKGQGPESEALTAVGLYLKWVQ